MEEISTLYRKHNYLNKDILYLKNVSIKEYDMSEAGFSLIQEFKLLPNSDIKYLLNNCDKKQRTILIGKLLISNKGLATELMNSFIIARKYFIEENQVSDDDILTIKKDAIFLVNKSVAKTSFRSFIKFKLKNIYTSYCYLNNKYELYYDFKKNNMVIKGLDNKFLNHPLLLEIKKMMRMIEINKDKNSIYRILSDLAYNYKTLNLNYEFYKEINEENLFRLKNNYQLNSNCCYTDYIGMNEIDMIDISYNYINFLLPFITTVI